MENFSLIHNAAKKSKDKFSEEDIEKFVDEKVYYEEACKRLKIAEKELFLNLKKSLGKKSFYCVWTFLFLVLGIVFIKGCGCLEGLDNSVIITLLTTTTANLYAIVLVIIKNLFSNSNFDEIGNL